VYESRNVFLCIITSNHVVGKRPISAYETPYKTQWNTSGCWPVQRFNSTFVQQSSSSVGLESVLYTAAGRNNLER